MLQNRSSASIGRFSMKKLKSQDDHLTNQHPGDLTSLRSTELGLHGEGLLL